MTAEAGLFCNVSRIESLYYYDTYGFTLRSEIPLPELRLSSGEAADAAICCECIGWSPNAVAADGTSFHLAAPEAYLYWQEVGTFLVRNGNEIIVDPHPGVEDRIIRLPLLGTVLAVLLHQRGHLVLHASAVAVAERVAVFLGAKGQGKSTLAAALYARSHALLTDDLVALSADAGERWMILPGFPQFKLWPDAASSLGDDPTLLPTLAAGLAKRARHAGEQFAPRAVPLGQIFVLGVGPALRLQRLQPQQALLELIANSYMARFGREVLQGPAATAHLGLCADLVRRIPIALLERPRSLALLSETARLVEAQMRSPV